MKLLIISDIHGNYDAWRALPERDYDELWVLGDLVNYGPQPAEVVAEVRAQASLIVQGNHDYAAGFEDNSLWSARYRPIAEATLGFTISQLNEDDKRFLRGLPEQTRAERSGTRFHLVHAAPSNPLYGRYKPDDDQWIAEVETAGADVLLVGHTHVPFMRKIGSKIVLNPGSVGQPRSGGSRASYAVWEDGHLELRTFEYPVEATVQKLRTLAFALEVETQLVKILETGLV